MKKPTVAVHEVTFLTVTLAGILLCDREFSL